MAAEPAAGPDIMTAARKHRRAWYPAPVPAPRNNKGLPSPAGPSVKQQRTGAGQPVITSAPFGTTNLNVSPFSGGFVWMFVNVSSVTLPNTSCSSIAASVPF